METHQHAIHLLLRCFFNVPCIPPRLETRSADFDLLKWVYTNPITSDFAQCLEIVTSIALLLLGYRAPASPFCSVHVALLCVSDAVGRSLTVVTFPTWSFLAAIGSPPFHLCTSAYVVHLHPASQKGSGLCSRSLSWCFQWGKKQITFFFRFLSWELLLWFWTSMFYESLKYL